MTIPEAREKCKSLLALLPRDALVVAVVVLASSASFGLGFLAGRDAGQGSVLRIEDVAGNVSEPETAVAPVERAAAGKVVASKNGAKYYPPDCVAAGRISEANKIWFVSAAAALEAGYEPAANCKGL